MHQGVLDPLKRRYKKHLLRFVVRENDSQPVTDVLKTITLKDVIHWVARSWKEASEESLKKAWKYLLPAKSFAANEEADPFEDVDTAELIDALGFGEGSDNWENLENGSQKTEMILVSLALA